MMRPRWIGSERHVRCSDGKPGLPIGETFVSWRDVTYVKIGNSGSGGSSNVSIALATTGPQRGITFAVKLFNAANREGWRLNFMREVHVLRDCDHPAIVKVFDEGVHRDGYPFIVMEYLPDKLSKAIASGRLDHGDKLSIVMQLLSALRYLSRRDPPVVHRDIKPSNIFLKKGTCVLGDFGLILQLEHSERQEIRGGDEGTVPEMPQLYRTPELIDYHNGGPTPPPASDVFQLGLVAAELFIGENPLLPDRPEKPVRMHALPEISGPLGVAIKPLLEQMLTPEATQRPSASDMLRKWHELFLVNCKRMHANRKAAGLKRIADPQSAMPEVTDQPGASAAELQREFPDDENNADSTPQQ